MTNKSFVERIREHQVAWAKKNGLNHLLEARHDSEPSWVLKREHKTRNLHNESWWQYIKGREHKWAQSLLSSQCFAVNVFGPLAENPLLAKRVLEELLQRTLEKDDEVSVLFEHTPKGAREWLGETKTPQSTQVDVFFTIQRFKKPIGYLLVEVKFTEHEFGSCRGAVQSTLTKPGNPDSSRCLNLQAVLANPKEMCWMADEEENGRHYWDFMQSPSTPFKFTSVIGCPFRQSLYQLMRNQVLAIALVQNTSADWAEFGVCVHPGNTEVRQLSEHVLGHKDALQAFNDLLPNKKKLIEINPLDIIELVRENDLSFSEWAEWMISRYDLH